MEVRKSKDMVMENKDAMTNGASVFENFPLSRTILQQNSKNMHIINAMNHLLSRYHPDDGITAYEHVLKTLLVLSEDFDSNTQQQIISVVPLPKGVSNEAIRDVICKTTGLIRTANNLTMCQKITLVSEEELNAEISNEKSKIHLSQNVLVDTSSQNLELDENFVPSVSEVFRGFPPNEISMIHSHVRNVNYVYDTLDYNIPCVEPCINIRQNLISNAEQQEESLKLQSNLKLKWIHTPHLLYKNNAYQVSSPSCQQGFFKPVDDKYFQLPVDKVGSHNQWNTANMSHTLRKDSTCFKKKLCKTKVNSHKEDATEISNVEIINSGTSFSNYYEFLHNENQDLRKYGNSMNESKVFNLERQKRFEQELKMEQQAIQQDTYKMDVVWNEEMNTVINSQISEEDNFIMDSFVVERKLKTSLQNFLKRAAQDRSIELPRLQQSKSLRTVPFTNKYWKFVTRKNLENKKQLNSSMNNESNLKDKDASENMKKLTDKKESGSLNIYPRSSQLQLRKKSLNIAPNKSQMVECEKKNNIENLLYKSAGKQTEQNDANLLQQTASVTELATYKKHYYDTLLNIQKAKVAVANSLAISSVESSAKYDPYYSSCSDQQQLLQQHGQLSLNPQFAVHTIAQSKLSNVHNAPYTWVRCNNWRHPTTRQLRYPQQSPFQHLRNKENSVLHYVKTVDVQCFAQDKNKQMKRCVQRKKLEEIVGKLKEIENTNINN